MKVSVGASHGLALKTDGTLVSWGDDSFRQVRGTPTGSFAAVAAGFNHSTAIRSDGSLASWGSDDFGQVSRTPRGRFVAVSEGHSFSMALREDGTIVTWGTEDGGVLSGTPSGSFKAIAAGIAHAVGIRTDGTLVSWGQIGPAPAGTYIAVAGGNGHSVAVRTDGTLVTWGQKIGEQSPRGTFQAVAAGNGLAVGLRTDGTLVTWGKSRGPRFTAPTGFFSAVALRNSDALAIRGNTPPELGNCPGEQYVNSTSSAGAIVTYATPTAVDIDGPVSVTCVPPSGSMFPVGTTVVTCTARDAGGLTDTCTFTVSVRDVTPPTVVEVVPPANGWYRAGNALDFTVKFSEPVSVSASPAFPTLPLVIGSTSRSALLLRVASPASLVFRYVVQTGDIDANGIAFRLPAGLSGTPVSDINGNIGPGTFPTPPSLAGVRIGTPPSISCPSDIVVRLAEGQSSVPVAYPPMPSATGIPAPAVTTVPPSGSSFPLGTTVVTRTARSPLGTATCTFEVTVLPPLVRPPEVTGTLVSWGSDRSGQVSQTPAGLFKGVSEGLDHAVGIRSDGTLALWGKSGIPAVMKAPVGTFTTVAAGFTHDVAIRTDGTLVSWGNDQVGQVSGTPPGRFVSVAVGQDYSVALRSDGRLVAWGSDKGGSGRAIGVVSQVPTGSFIAVAAGYDHAVAIRADGTLASWGEDRNGAVKNTPSGTFRAVAAGYDHSVAIRTDGSLVAWGDTGDRTPPPPGRFIEVAAGYYFSVARGEEGALKAWGGNSQGALGQVPVGTFAAVSTRLEVAVGLKLSPPPALAACPADTTVDATSAAGAAVTFATPTASGDGPVTVTCSPPSGSLFPMGTTTVTCTATDTYGRSDTCSFQVTVQDLTPPAIARVIPPSNGWRSPGAALDFALRFNEPVAVTVASGTPSLAIAVGAVARDASFVGGSGTAELLFRYILQPGDLDADGIQLATSLAVNGGTISDAAGNPAELTLPAVDTGGILAGEPPTVNCPANVVVTAPSGQTTAIVNYAPPTTTGFPAPQVTTVPPSGSAFHVGTTTVTSTASNPLGTVHCSFTVTVLSDSCGDIVVTSAADSGPGSLRQAILDSCPGHVIRFDPALTGQTISLTSGELTLDKDLTIAGLGWDKLTVSGSGVSRVFYVAPGTTAKLEGLMITGSDGRGSVLAVSMYGGAICNYLGAVTLEACLVTANTTRAVSNVGGTATLSQCTLSANTGGGILTRDASHPSTLTIRASRISDNPASFVNGAGIYSEGSDVTLEDSVVSNNSSTIPISDFFFTYGGGLYVDGGTLAIRRCTIQDNTAKHGGGIWIHHSSIGGDVMTIESSTISGNSAKTGGGIYHLTDVGGGDVTLVNCTLSGNSALATGGGIANMGLSGLALAKVRNCTFKDNTAPAGGGIYNWTMQSDTARIEIGHTVLGAAAAGGNYAVSGPASVTDLGYNLSDDATAVGFATQIADLRLGVLADNGGPTWTHAIGSDSPAFDAGDPAFDGASLPLDQRGTGFPRVAGQAVDIGAFEFQGPF